MTPPAGDRPGRRVPVASPEAESAPNPMADPQVGAKARLHGRVPATGGPDFLRGAGNLAHRLQRQRVTRRVAISTLLVAWAITWMIGRGETVILVSPYDIPGRNRPNGDTPISAAVVTVSAINKQVRSLQTPGFELRIGAPSLDRSMPSTEQVRWLVTAPELRLRAAQGWWYADSSTPSDGVIVPQLMLQRTLWALTGRRVMVFRGELLAADGRPTLQTKLDGRPLDAQTIRGRDWKNGLYQVNEALLADHAPIGAMVAYLRQHDFERARGMSDLLLLDTDKGNDLFASAAQIYITQAEAGGVQVPARAYEDLWTAGSAPAPRWTDALIDWWPGRARRRRMEASVLHLAAAQTMESGSFSMGCALAEQASVRWRGNRTSRLMLAYGYFRQRGSHDLVDARDICIDLAEHWPTGEPNHAANLLHEVMREIHDWPEMLERAEQLAFPAAPGDPVLLNNRAVWSWYRKQYASVRTNLDAALEAWPRRVVALENRAVVAAFDGELLVGGQYFDRARTRSGYLASTWLHPARFLFDHGDYGLAADLLDEGATLVPTSYEIKLQSAYARAAERAAFAATIVPGTEMVIRGQPPEEISARIEAVLDPAVPPDRYWLYRGHVAYLLGDLATADMAYRASEKAEEASGIATYGIAQTAFLEQQWQQSSLHFGWFLAKDPAHTRGRLFYYLALLLEGQANADSMLRESAKAEDRGWIRGVMELYLGERSPQAVRIGAYSEEGVSDTERRRREVVVEFHIGVWRLRQDPANPEGWEALRKVVSTGLSHHYEYQAAVALLRSEIRLWNPAASAAGTRE